MHSPPAPKSSKIARYWYEYLTMNCLLPNRCKPLALLSYVVDKIIQYKCFAIKCLICDKVPDQKQRGGVFVQMSDKDSETLSNTLYDRVYLKTSTTPLQQ